MLIIISYLISLFYLQLQLKATHLLEIDVREPLNDVLDRWFETFL